MCYYLEPEAAGCALIRSIEWCRACESKANSAVHVMKRSDILWKREIKGQLIGGIPLELLRTCMQIATSWEWCHFIPLGHLYWNLWIPLGEHNMPRALVLESVYKLTVWWKFQLGCSSGSPNSRQNHHLWLFNGFWWLSSHIDRQIGESGRSVASR